jgi:tripartite-type tricarboxylate transporter receptor subunit TctC
LNYATGNPTGIVATGQILSLAGNVSMVQVPYKGEPAGMLDLVANRVQLMIVTPTTAGQFVKEGKLRMLATTLPTRSPAYPDVPTMVEAGLPRFSVPSWAALQGPAKMPKEIVDRLAREMAGVLKRPDVLEQLSRQQFIAASSTPEQLSGFIREQLELYAKTLKESGVQPE